MRSLKLCKRLMAVVVTTAILLSSINVNNVFAETGAVSKSTGKDQMISSNGSRPLHHGAIIFDISTIDNSLKGQKFTVNGRISAGGKAVKEIGQCDAVIANKYLYNYPTYMYDQSRVSKQGLLLLTMTTKANMNIKYYLMDKDNYRSKDSYKRVYATRNEANKQHFINDKGEVKELPLNLMQKWLNTPGKEKVKTAFYDGELDVDVLEAWYDKIKSTQAWKDEVQSFVDSWDYESEAMVAIRKAFKTKGDNYKTQCLKYCEFLLIINEMCNGTHWDQIEYYLHNLNMNDSNKFIVVTMACAVNYGDPAGQIYPLPVYYARVTDGHPISKYLSFGNAMTGKKYKDAITEILFCAC